MAHKAFSRELNADVKYKTDEEAREAVAAMGDARFAEFMLIPTANLVVPEYQRAIKPHMETYIVRAYEPGRFEPLKVSMRRQNGGDYTAYVTDGQQRLRAARRLGLDRVPAMVEYDTTVQDEVHEFIRLQDARIRLTTAEKLDSKLVGEDPLMWRMIDIMARHGYAAHSPKGKYLGEHLDVLNGVAEIILRFRQNEAIFEETLSIMRECWGGEKYSTQTDLFSGLFFLLLKHHAELDMAALRRRLKTVTPRELFMRARAMHYSVRCKSNRVISHFLLELYNRGRKHQITNLFLNVEAKEDEDSA
jgi:hypothetical protein